MTKPNYTKILCILDRSGSMWAIQSDMEGGYNTFIDQQKESSNECDVTLVQFDHDYQTVYANRKLSEVPKLNLVPRGGTALYDAVGRSITTLGEQLANMKEEDRPSQVVVMIITDGYENASKEFSASKIKEMIEHQKKAYNWSFLFLGANQDAVVAAQRIGIAMNCAVTYDANAQGVSEMMRGVGTAVLRSRTGQSQSLSYSQDDYTRGMSERKKESKP